MNWIVITEGIYLAILVMVCLRIIYDTRNSSKAIAYLLLAIFIPFIGMIIYFFFEINYWKRKLYDAKFVNDKALLDELKQKIISYTAEALQQNDPALQSNKELAYMLLREQFSPLTRKNKVQLLVNGENKFPEVLQALRQAKHHIHIEYYIFENDEIGNQVAEILLQKAKEGVKVRFIYDDFGSSPIRKKMVPRLEAGGVDTYPFYKVVFILLANRLNYRNHRKIIVIDGYTAFTGGINISDRYINDKPGKLYWRDTHIRIDGPGVYYLQYLFLADWNFCSGEMIQPDKFLFPGPSASSDDMLVQVAASGPDSDQPTILYSLLQAFYLAQEEILVTTPYFIPSDSILEAFKIAALSGLSVKLLVPGISDLKFVNAAARSYYKELMEAGVEIYRYNKGFVHAKTLIADGKLSVIGSANMDLRSFELNFEVNSLIYDRSFSEKLRDVFFEDIKYAEKIDLESWRKRPAYLQLAEKVARLVFPLL